MNSGAAVPEAGARSKASVGSSHHGVAFWVLGALGWAAIGFAVWGVVAHPGGTHPANFGVWFLGGALVHDLVIAPVVLLVGVALRRKVTRGRAAIQVAIVVSATLCLYSLPVLLGVGGLRDNQTLLPRNETAGLLAALAVVWGAAIVAMVLVRRRVGRRVDAAGESTP